MAMHQAIGSLPVLDRYVVASLNPIHIVTDIIEALFGKAKTGLARTGRATGVVKFKHDGLLFYAFPCEWLRGF